MASAKPTPIDDDALRSIVAAEITSAVGYQEGTIATERALALKYYRSEPFGNEVKGRSKVVMSDVQDTVEWIMPSLMRIFLSGSTACKYKPSAEQYEEQCEQMTDYANHVVFEQNDGFSTIYSWFKDALIQKNGMVKVFWSEEEKSERTNHTGLTEDELIYMLSQPVEGEIKVTQSREYAGEADGSIVPMIDEAGQAVLDEMGSPMMMEAPPPQLVDVTLERTWTHKQIGIEGLPPEEFIISREARSMDHARVKGHRMRKTVSWCVENGFDREQCVNLSTTNPTYSLFNTEAVARRTRENELPRSSTAMDESTREVDIVELYIDADRDGDGFAEQLQIFVGGDGHEILKKADGEMAIERIDVDQPFIDLTPIPMPHVFFGRSMFDLVGDLQLINSILLRQVLDNSYGMNNNRVAISNKVDLDDLLVQRPDGVVRVDTDMPDAGGHIMPMPVQPLGQFIFPTMEFMKTVGEQRTGVIRLSQGLDAETLDDTMGGQAKLMQQAAQRVELIARVFAETGFKKLFDLIGKLSIAHQDKATNVKLRNEWVDVDPRTWNSQYKVSAEVGLGYDSREQEAFAIERLLQKYLTIVPMQGDLEGPLVTMPKLHNALDKYTTSLGLKDADDYWEDPSSPQMQQVMAQKKQQAAQQAQQADPAMALAQGQIQNDQAKVRVDATKAQADEAFRREKLAADERIAMHKINADTTIKREQIVASMNETAAKVAADDARAAANLEAQAEQAREKIESEHFGRQLDRQAADEREERQAGRDAAEKVVTMQLGEDGSLSGAVSQGGGPAAPDEAN